MPLLDIISVTAIQVLTPSTAGLDATKGNFVFEQRLHAQHLPPVSAALTAVDFARAIVGESVHYEVYRLKFSNKLPDGLYTLTLLNMELAKGFVNNSHPADVLTFSAFGNRIQAKIKYEGFRFLVSGTGIGSVLGFQSNIPSDDVDVFSAPGGEVFTSTFTRRRLARASPKGFIVAANPSLVSTDNLMHMTLQVHDRSGKTIFGLTRALSNGTASFTLSSIPATGLFQMRVYLEGTHIEQSLPNPSAADLFNSSYFRFDSLGSYLVEMKLPFQLKIFPDAISISSTAAKDIKLYETMEPFTLLLEKNISAGSGAHLIMLFAPEDKCYLTVSMRHASTHDDLSLYLTGVTPTRRRLITNETRQVFDGLGVHGVLGEFYLQFSMDYSSNTLQCNTSMSQCPSDCCTRSTPFRVFPSGLVQISPFDNRSCPCGSFASTTDATNSVKLMPWTFRNGPASHTSESPHVLANNMTDLQFQLFQGLMICERNCSLPLASTATGTDLTGLGENTLLPSFKIAVYGAITQSFTYSVIYPTWLLVPNCCRAASS